MPKYSRVLGIDVSKKRLDGRFLLDGERGGAAAWDNDAAGIAAIVAAAQAARVEAVAVEASGGYEKPLVRALRAAAIVVLVLDPAAVRSFARLRGRLAKNDRADALTIAEFASLFGEERPPRPAVLETLAQHLAWYEHVSEDLARWRTRRGAYDDPEMRQCVSARIAELKQAKKAARKRLQQTVAACRELREKTTLLASAPGVGFITAVVLAVRLPELGAISRKKLAALVGLAPWDDDSGQRRGRRKCKGGRVDVRTGAFMAARTAARCNPVLAPFFQRLLARGKKKQLATLAVLRRLLVMLNAMVRDGRRWAAP
jgi:transposase